MLLDVGDRYGLIAPGYVFDAIVLDDDPSDLAFARDGGVAGVFKRARPWSHIPGSAARPSAPEPIQISTVPGLASAVNLGRHPLRISGGSWTSTSPAKTATPKTTGRRMPRIRDQSIETRNRYAGASDHLRRLPPAFVAAY